MQTGSNTASTKARAHFHTMSVLFFISMFHILVFAFMFFSWLWNWLLPAPLFHFSCQSDFNLPFSEKTRYQKLEGTIHVIVPTKKPSPSFSDSRNERTFPF